MMSPLNQPLIPYPVSTEHLKIKLAHDKIINGKLLTVEIKTITFKVIRIQDCRSQWPRGLSHKSATARLLRS